MLLSRMVIFTMGASRIALLVFCALWLAACSGPLPEQEASFAGLGQVSIRPVEGREGQIYRHELQRLLERNPQTIVRYELTTSIRLTYPEDQVDMGVSIALYDRNSGSVVLMQAFTSSVSVGGVASLYGAEAARNNARERLAIHSARKVYRYLTLYFLRRDLS